MTSTIRELGSFGYPIIHHSLVAPWDTCGHGLDSSVSRKSVCNVRITGYQEALENGQESRCCQRLKMDQGRARCGEVCT